MMKLAKEKHCQRPTTVLHLRCKLPNTLPMNLNHVTLAGRLTREPETRYTQSGTAIADISLAVTRYWRNDKGESQEEVAFIDVTAFGRSAEMIQKHLHKGREIFVDGHLKLDQWDDKQTGAKRSKLKVIADSLQFVGPKPQAAQPEAPAPSPALEKQREQRQAATAPKPQHDPDLDIEPDDPF
jgi:single-strand DNA-binding protein